MSDLIAEIELLERCAAECALISDLATDPRARYQNRELATEYHFLAHALRSSSRSSTSEEAH